MTPTDNTKDRDRRVSDKPDFLEAAKHAVDLAELRGEHRLLAQQVKSSVDGFSHTLNTVQIEMRNLSKNITELTGLQHGHDANNIAIGKIEGSVSDLGKKLDEWFEDFEQAQAGKWEKYEADRDRWRSAHEADNRDTRERLIRWNGVGFAVVLLGGAVVAGFLWVLNMRFQDAKDDSEVLAQRHVLHEAQQAKLVDKTHEMELYLARTGYQAQGATK